MVQTPLISSLKQAFARGELRNVEEILRAEELRLDGQLRMAESVTTVRHLQGQLFVIANVLEALT